MKTPNIGFYAGSFDPITNGHIWVIGQGLKLFDSLYIGIGTNTNKKSYFTVQERIEMIENCLFETYFMTFQKRTAYVVSYENEFTVEIAKEHDATHLLRGIRNPQDFAYEMEIKQFNDELQPGIETLFVTPPHKLSIVSSSLIKGCVGMPGWENIVSEKTTPYVIEKFKERLQLRN